MQNAPLFALCCLGLALAICMVPVAREALFERSIDDIKWIREAMNPTIAHFVERSGEFLVTPQAYQLTLLMLSAFNRPDWTFIASMAGGFAITIAAVEKLYFQSPRPYFIDQEIPVDCRYLDYGSPSAHALIGVVNWGSVWASVIGSHKVGRTCEITTGLLILLPTVLLICLSRVYVGNHSIDQVLCGSIQGFILFYIIAFVCQKDTRNWYKNMARDHTYSSLLGHPITLFFVGANILSFLILRSHSDPVPQLWIDNIESRCGVLKAH